MSNNARHINPDRKGIPFVVSAPSGAGKTTLCREVQKDLDGLSFSVSHTTRTPREGEVSGRDYHFVDIKKFRSLIDAGAFIEWAEVHGNLYGTSLEEIQRSLLGGEDLLIEIDVQGAAQLREKLPEAVFVFVLPPDLNVLEERLRGRGTDDDSSIQRRLAIAVREISEQKNYDYRIVNDELELAAHNLAGIIRAERCRVSRFKLP